MSSHTITNQPRDRVTSSPQRGHHRRSVARHEANCANCGTATTLPFKPSAARPGYCPTCFAERKNTQVSEPLQSDGDDRERLRRERPEQGSHPEIFAGLDLRPRTRSALSRMGITTPTPIQEQAIPWLNEGRDVVGQAQTGSGKTLAFGIPLVENCSRSAEGIQGLVLVPTRELAIQVASVLEDIAEHRVSITLLYGGRPLPGEKRVLQKGVQIVVGTPGRTLDHLRQGNLKLGSVRMLVLDEADEMLDRGFARDVESIIAETPTKRQTALFSATLPDWVAKTSDKHLRDPKTVQVMTEAGDVPKIEHLIYKMDKATKTPALRTLLEERGDAPILVFGKTKHGVKKLAKQLADLGYPVTALQGNLSQNAREKAMADFRSGATPVLVATNVAARGLDIEGISQVINYDLPDSIQLFTHRVGRTGRMGKSGEAITFVTPDDEKKWREIERGFDTKIEIKRWGANGPEAMRESGNGAPPSPRRTPTPPRAPANGARPAQRRGPWREPRRAN
jgi:CxxC-x17-CxxC domain-containing protein